MSKLNINPAVVKAAASGDLENFLVAATPGGIERQEAMGQAAFVGTRNTLPKNCPRSELEKLGFVFHGDADDLFVNVTLPAGWSKKATDHSMWSDLLDPQGRKRAGIFYKAAFYDRSAHMRLDRRYWVGGEYLNAKGEPHDWKSNAEPTGRRTVVKDNATGANVYEGAAHGRNDYSSDDAEQKKAEAWIAEHFPDHHDVTAYWG